MIHQPFVQIAKADWHPTDVPPSLNHIAEAIEKSRWMLELEDDWDGEGSPAYSEETWLHAAGFLLKNALDLWQDRGVRIDAPAVHNGPEGSIDIYWETADRKLLIKVPANSEEPASFYGYDSRGNEVKGTLSLDETNTWLMMWQME